MGSEQSTLSERDEGADIKGPDFVSFLINSKEYVVSPMSDPQIGPESLLIDYIRDRAALKGTKYMCREGGCGACAVVMTTRNPINGATVTKSVNSCLMPVLGCDGWDIKTVEHLGSARPGGQLHPIQKRMVDLSASQCGYCTPGWVMNMYGIMEGKRSMLAKDIEDCMDGNICRCTGYRPILDAMKSFSLDASEELKRKCGDFGGNFDCCGNSCAPAGQEGRCCGAPLDNGDSNEQDELIEGTEAGSETSQDFVKVAAPLSRLLSFKAGEQWVKATDLETMFMAIRRFLSMRMNYRLVAGNTAKGVYKFDGPYQAYVEINSIVLLKRETVDPQIFILGGAVTINDAIECLKKAGTMTPDYAYCTDVAKHWSRVANHSIRNSATLAGNLMIKHGHREFPSDIFIVLEAIGAMLMIALDGGMKQMKTVEEFLGDNMIGKIILAIHFPKLKGFHFRSFKISRRYQNAHAYVNAGFLLQSDPSGSFYVKQRPRIVFGGIAPTFVHAMATENFLIGKSLQNEKEVQAAMLVLDKELKPEVSPPDAGPDYLKMLAQGLLYKFILGVLGDSAKPNVRMGGAEIMRGVSYGKQSYDTHKADWPIYQPVTKLEGPIQVTGEAEYTNDISPTAGELAAAFVLTKVGNAEIGQVDPAEALAVPGVITFVGPKDIPGANNYMTTHAFPVEFPDVIFVQDKISYAGQPVGVIVAETREIALKAAHLVKLKYINVKPPILDIPSALEKARQDGTLDQCTIKVVKSEEVVVTKEGVSAGHKISGEFRVGSQYHFQMEPQVVICIPREGGMDVHAASQWITQMQNSVADCLGMPANTINVMTRRVGGGFGGKLARASHVATACAVAAHKVNRPVRFVVDLESMMCALGKRHPYMFKYTVEYDDTGKITSLNIPFFSDAGCTANEPTALMALLCMQSCYSSAGWQLAPGTAVTNSPPNTYCRAPGSTPGIACIEYIMDHIAFMLKKDPMEVRLVNLMKKGDPIFVAPGKVLEEDNLIPGILEDMTTSADLEERKKFIQNFNQTNRWRKRALGMVSMSYAVHYFFAGYSIYISVYAKDGTVSLQHSGIEMGQGINTKVAQVVARQLGITVDKIKVLPTTSYQFPAGALTGAAVTSEHVCYSAVKACEILNARFAPIKEKMAGASWEVLVGEAHKAGLDLTSYYNTTVHDKLQNYNVWGMTACEVEIDVLTGEYKIVRVDLTVDTGMSLSPEVDIGQVEGAFIMGTGIWLTEKLQRDQKTGELLTNRTWDYKPPLAKDIPEDFRVTFLPKASNPHGVLRSKATGEPPVCMGVVVFLALKQAIAAARADAGNTDFFPMNGPVTPEDIQQLCLTSPSQFTT